MNRRKQFSPSLQRAALNRLYQSDFRRFNAKAFEELHGGQLSSCWHHDAIAAVLEKVTNGDIKRLLITMPPRSLKSHMVSVAFPAWFLGKDPTKKIIATSYGDDLAVSFANDWRNILSSPWYQSTFPATKTSAHKNREGETQLTKGGMRLSLSAGGSLTGRGADLIIIDDPLKASDAYSEPARNRINDWYGRTVVSRLNDKVNGAIVVVMQRLHPADLAGHLIESGEWHHLNLPAIAPIEKDIDTGRSGKKTWAAGEPLQPKREPIEVLSALKAEIGSRDFNAQYLQTPVPAEGNVIKLGYFERGEPSTDGNATTELVMSIDTANVGKSTSDYSVVQVWKMLDKQYALIEQCRGQWDYPDLRGYVHGLSLKHCQPRILVEEAGIGFALVKDLKKDGHNTQAIKPEGSKEQRLAKALPVIESGRVYLPEKACWLGDFEAEVAAFPAGRYDDQVDAMTQFINWAQSYTPFHPSMLPKMRMAWG